MGDDIQPAVVWVDGQLVTAASLNAFLADAALKATYITAKTLITNLALVDEFSVVQGGVVKKATAQKIHDLIVPAGSFIQRVKTSSSSTDSTATNIPFDNTKPQNTEGKEYSALTLTITPQYANSIIRLSLDLRVSALVAANTIGALFRDSVVDAIGTGLAFVDAVNVPRDVIIRVDDAPATTAAVVYKVRFGVGGATTSYVNRITSDANLFNGTFLSTLEAIEIKQ